MAPVAPMGAVGAIKATCSDSMHVAPPRDFQSRARQALLTARDSAMPITSKLCTWARIK